jgi:hypothetical protein
MKDREWNIININGCSEDSNSDQCNSDENNETVPLLDLEKGEQKEIKVAEPTSSRKRIRLINYTISGSGFIEEKGRKRLKLNDNNYVNINIAPHNRRQRPRSILRRLLRPHDPCWIIILLLFVVMIFVSIMGYIVIQNCHEYFQYKYSTPTNSTLSYNDWFYCRY